jgi:hypothetical protein
VNSAHLYHQVLFFRLQTYLRAIARSEQTGTYLQLGPAQRSPNGFSRLGLRNASTLSEVTRTDPVGREHKARELGRVRDGCTRVVWILNAVLVLKIQHREEVIAGRRLPSRISLWLPSPHASVAFRPLRSSSLPFPGRCRRSTLIPKPR